MKARQNGVGSQMLKKTGNFNYDKCCKGRHGAMSPHGGFVAAMKRWSASWGGEIRAEMERKGRS